MLTCFWFGILMPAIRAMPPVSRRGYAKRASLPAIRIMYNPLTLALLVSRVGANDPDHTLAPHDFAVAAQLFYRCPDFHSCDSCFTADISNTLESTQRPQRRRERGDSSDPKISALSAPLRSPRPIPRAPYRDKPMPPPVRLAFLSRLSYWCDIRCGWTCALKSIQTLTIMSRDGPPNSND